MLVFGRDVVDKYFYRRRGQYGLDAAIRRYDAWLAEMLRASWRDPAALKSQYRSASIVADRVVFNISGNNYRLVVRVSYQARVVEIRWFGTHAEYDRIKVETV